MSGLGTLHQRLGMALLLVLAGAALAAPVVGRPSRMASWRAYVRCCAAAVAVQAVSGLLLVAAGHTPRNALHWVYGGALLVALPLAVRLASRATPSRERLVVGVGALAAVLLALRAALTGG